LRRRSVGAIGAGDAAVEQTITKTTGSAVLVRDGRRYDWGGLSSEVVEAVSGNPAAENEAPDIRLAMELPSAWRWDGTSHG
jgi:hypothetical protein